MVARANKVMMDMPMKPKETPSTVRMNLKKHPMPQSHMKLGATMNMMMKCKVMSIHQDEYGKMMEMEVMDMKHMDHEEEGKEDA